MAALSVSANFTEKVVETFVNNSTLTSSSANSAFPPNVILKKVPGSTKLRYRPNTELPAGIISLDIIFKPWFDLWNNDPISFRIIFSKKFPAVPPIVFCHNEWPDKYKRATPCNAEEQIVSDSGRINLYILTEAGWLEDYPLESVVYSLRLLLESTCRWNQHGEYIHNRKISIRDEDLGSLWPNFIPGQPYSTKHTNEDYGKVNVKLSFFEEQGTRPSMEDAMIRAVPLGLESRNSNNNNSDSRYCLFGVLDGHGGASCSLYASKYLQKLIGEKLPDDSANPRKIMWESILKVDDEWLKAQRDAESPDESGSTACVILLDTKKYKIYCSNLGDSRALLCRGNQCIQLSFDQKPAHPRETAFTVENGGFISGDRINGSLGVARAIGDMYFKDEDYRYMNNEPDITEMALTPQDRFLLCACDGLYDVMNNNEIIAFILERLRQEKDMTSILQELVSHAIEVLGSTDNVSVCVLELDWIDQESNDKLSSLPVVQAKDFGEIRRRSRSKTRRTTKLFSQTALQDAGLALNSDTNTTASEKRKLLSKLDQEVAKKTEINLDGTGMPISYWSQHTDDKGRIFYFNETTQISTWTKPESLKWLKATSNDGKVYYYHEETRETSWKKPDV
eukprot:g9896.t1